MCLYIDDYGDYEILDYGTRTARKPHRCEECYRTITPGERYEYVVGVYDAQASTFATCSHCRAVVTLGSRLTGCPEQWNGSMMYDREPEIGFVANIIEDDGHNLSRRDRLRMLRCYAAAKRQWRWSDGTLMDVPAVPEAVSP